MKNCTHNLKTYSGPDQAYYETFFMKVMGFKRYLYSQTSSIIDV